MRNIVKLVVASALSLVASGAFAATISGTLNLTGSYAAAGGTDLSDATVIDLSGGSVNATAATGDFASTISFPPPIGSGTSTMISPFAPVIDFLTIGGWQLDLSSLNIVDQEADLLTLTGTGVLSGNGFEATNASWTFSAESASSYSMSITEVPIPAAAWLFGSALVGLAGIRRKT